MSPVSAHSADLWQKLLKQFKERVAQRLWSLPSLSESEKELFFREVLSDLDRFEQELSKFQDEILSQQKVAHDENDLLRSLLGVDENDLKVKVLSLGQDLTQAQRELADRHDQIEEMNRRVADLDLENEHLRKRIQELEQTGDRFRVQQLRLREDDVKYFSEAHEGLKNELKDVQSRIVNLRELFAQTNQQLLSDKQEEISLLQKKLLDDLEATLQRKQQLAWGEEEMFAKGVAHRVRTTLVSAQGQLLLTLERLGLLDPSSKNEVFWKARLRLLIEGAPELSASFRSIQTQIQEVTSTLDDYLHLTGRREIVRDPVLLKELVQEEIAEIYTERKPTLLVEFLSDDPLPSVLGDSPMIRFAIEALLRNAREALPGESGQVTIALKNHSEKGYIAISIRDTGSGVPAHLTPRLFQPFFTTKERRQGLSLSRARRYVEMHGGRLQLEQSGPNGSVFQIQLPLAGTLTLASGPRVP